MRNGELLDAAEREGFAVLVTTDTGLKHQQKLRDRHLPLSFAGDQLATHPARNRHSDHDSQRSEVWELQRIADSLAVNHLRVAVQFVITVIGAGVTCSSSTTLTRNRCPSGVTS